MVEVFDAVFYGSVLVDHKIQDAAKCVDRNAAETKNQCKNKSASWVASGVAGITLPKLAAVGVNNGVWGLLDYPPPLCRALLTKTTMGTTISFLLPTCAMAASELSNTLPGILDDILPDAPRNWRSNHCIPEKMVGPSIPNTQPQPNCLRSLPPDGGPYRGI